MSDQPKPTDEWTTEYVHELIKGIGADARIACAHNACVGIMEGQVKDLQHERDILRQAKAEQREEWHDTLKQLAAERETREVSTQPKPTGEYICPCHGYKYQSRECCLHIDEDQPNHTVEWTVESVWKEFSHGGVLRIKKLADAHNAALAAEREKLAERHKLCVDFETKWKAEKEKSRVLGNMTDGLRIQLAAAKEALQMLRDFQNGCPLPSYEKGWNEAMAMSDKVLRN